MKKIKKNFGFGCMRLPMAGDRVDTAEFTRMVDAYLEAGFNYFDTASVYIGGQSETALRECLTARYPREAYFLTDKLSGSLFEREDEIRPLLERQLRTCGVDCFDLYLMHAQSAKNFGKFRACRAYETAFQLREEGKIRHVGLSFHDTAEVLEEILDCYPQVEAVQLQFNYMDYEDPAVQSRRCYEVCQRHGKPVIVMEPVKGGMLADLPEEVRQVLDGLGGGSPASYALRFAAGFPGIIMVLSGMSNLPQMIDNLGCMKDFRPLDDRERQTISRVCGILHAADMIPCTACRYCVDGCPQSIPIPDIFASANAGRIYQNWSTGHYLSLHRAEAGSCIRCGACEEVCPQKLPIRALLEKVAAED